MHSRVKRKPKKRSRRRRAKRSVKRSRRRSVKRSRRRSKRRSVKRSRRRSVRRSRRRSVKRSRRRSVRRSRRRRIKRSRRKSKMRFSSPSKKWIVYTLPGCGACDSAKSLLKSKGLPFTARSVGIEKYNKMCEAAKKKVGKGNYKYYPVIFTPHGKMVEGYSELKKRLK